MLVESLMVVVLEKIVGGPNWSGHAAFFNQSGTRKKTFFPALGTSYIFIASSCDWLISLFAFVVIGQRKLINLRRS